MKSWIIFIIIAFLLIGSFGFIQIPEKQTPSPINVGDTFKVANWNLLIFGDSKAENTEVMNFYANSIKNYDIIFVQEIRDADGSSFELLCSMLADFDCAISSRAGRSTSKEQYGLFYRKGIQITYMKDYNPDFENRWERPPIEVTFNVYNYTFTAYNIHTKPEDTPNELNELEAVVKDEGNVMVLGDLNADCLYYDNQGEDFASWNWLITDDMDTTLSERECAYDRIIVNKDMSNEVVRTGIAGEGVTIDISDHYLVWTEVSIE